MKEVDLGRYHEYPHIDPPIGQQQQHPACAMESNEVLKDLGAQSVKKVRDPRGDVRGEEARKQ